MEVVANYCSKLGRRKKGFNCWGNYPRSHRIPILVSPPRYAVVAKQKGGVGGGGVKGTKESFSFQSSMDIMCACLLIPCLSIGVVGNTMIFGVWNIPGSDAMDIHRDRGAWTTGSPGFFRGSL